MKISTSWLWFPTWLVNFKVQANNVPWWIEVSTTHPKCLYYFGPFESYREAKEHRAGFLEDLEKENAQGIRWTIKRTQPKSLTIFEEEEEESVRELEMANV